MENDSIRPSGSNTLVDIWIKGKLRAISISREAIEAFLGFDQAAGMTETDRCEFVRRNLPLVVKTAEARLDETDFLSDSINIEAGQFPNSGNPMGDRRKTERRKGERRRVNRPKEDLPVGERRRSNRRSSQRRRPADRES